MTKSTTMRTGNPQLDPQTMQPIANPTPLFTSLGLEGHNAELIKAFGSGNANAIAAAIIGWHTERALTATMHAESERGLISEHEALLEERYKTKSAPLEARIERSEAKLEHLDDDEAEREAAVLADPNIWLARQLEESVRRDTALRNIYQDGVLEFENARCTDDGLLREAENRKAQTRAVAGLLNADQAFEVPEHHRMALSIEAGIPNIPATTAAWETASKLGAAGFVVGNMLIIMSHGEPISKTEPILWVASAGAAILAGGAAHGVASLARLVAARRATEGALERLDSAPLQGKPRVSPDELLLVASSTALILLEAAIGYGGIGGVIRAENLRIILLGVPEVKPTPEFVIVSLSLVGGTFLAISALAAGFQNGMRDATKSITSVSAWRYYKSKTSDEAHQAAAAASTILEFTRERANRDNGSRLAHLERLQAAFSDLGQALEAQSKLRQSLLTPSRQRLEHSRDRIAAAAKASRALLTELQLHHRGDLADLARLTEMTLNAAEAEARHLEQLVHGRSLYETSQHSAAPPQKKAPNWWQRLMRAVRPNKNQVATELRS